MSNKNDDDFWTILALYWLMQDEKEEKKPDDTDGNSGCLLFLVFMIGGLVDNPYWKAASVAVLAYFLWNNFRGFSKFLVKVIFCIFFSALVGCFLQPIFGSRLVNFDSKFGLVLYVVAFLYGFIVVCPWVTKKAREILNKR